MKFPRHTLSLFLALALASLACAQVLKQSTAVTLQIGPAVAASDGNTEVADLTITEIEISKAGGTFAAPNGSATLTLDDDGFYKLALTTADTDTLGLLVVKVVDATAMTWGERYQVIAANAYDGIYGSGDYLQVDAMQVEGSDATDQIDARIAAYDAPTNAEMVARTLVAASYATASNQTAIEADTQDIQSRLPAALVAGRMSSDAVAISGSTVAADAVETNIGNLDASVASRLASAGYTAPLDAAGTRAAVGLATANLDTQLSGLSTAIGSPLQAGSYTAPDNASITTIKGVTDKLDTGLESDGATGYQWTTLALENAPAGGGGGGDATLANQTTIIGHLTDIKGATFDGATDSVEAIRNRGDAAWLTATGFSTHTAADVWTSGTRTLTASTNFNDLSSAQVETAVGNALTAAAITEADLRTTIWGAARASYNTAGTMGEAANSILTYTASMYGDDYSAGFATLNSAVGIIDGNIDNLTTMLEDDGAGGYQLTTLALENAPSGSATVDPADIQAGLTAQGYTTTRAALLDNADVPTSTRAEATSAGSGAFAITTTVTDGVVPLQNAKVRVTEGANSFVAETNASGQAAFSLDAATYTTTASKAGYSFTPVTRTVTGNETGTLTDPLAMTAITLPAAPADLALCRVYGTFESIDGTPVAGVEIEITLMGRGGIRSDRLIGLRTIQATTNAAGQLIDADGNPYLDLQRNDLLTPSGTTYTVNAPAVGLRKVTMTLASETFDLATLVTE